MTYDNRSRERVAQYRQVAVLRAFLILLSEIALLSCTVSGYVARRPVSLVVCRFIPPPLYFRVLVARGNRYSTNLINRYCESD